MKLYLIKYRDDADPMPSRQMWRTSAVKAQSTADWLRKDGMVEVSVNPIEVPTNKKDLVLWLNDNCYLR